MRNRKFRPSAESLEGRQLLSAAPQYSVIDLGFNGAPYPHALSIPMPDLLNPDGQGPSWAYGQVQNNSGQIAGYAAPPLAPYSTGRQVAFLYSNGTMTNLTPGSYLAESHGINNSGQVVGWAQYLSNYPGGWEQAFVTGPNGIGTTFLTDGINGSSEALGINSKGDVVGMGKGAKAFLYENGVMYNLNDLIPNNLGYNITRGFAITDNGQIIADGYDLNGSTDFLLTPIAPPTPTSPTITWENPANITYGTPISATQLNATADVPGTFTYDVAAGTVLHAGETQVIHATFTPIDTSLYTMVTATASINVLKAPLTVTANYLTRASWQVNPTLTGTITGLVNGDTDVATYTTTATNSSPVGDYPIVPHLTDSNYNITFVNGNLTITQTANTGVSFANGTINISGYLASGNVADVSIDPANQKIKVVFNWFVIEYDPAIVTKIIYNGSQGGHDIYNNHTTIESVATGFGGGNTFSSNSNVSTWSMYGSGNSIHSDHGVNWVSRHSYSVLEIGTGTFYDVV